MKNRMLVGAAGLALAGVAIAQDAVIHARPTSVGVDAHIKMRNAALGEPGTNARAAAIEEIKRGIATGAIDPLTVLVPLDDIIPNLGGVSDVTVVGPMNLAPIETVIVPGNGLFGIDDYNGYIPTSFVDPPNSLVGFAGQPNPFGQVANPAFFRYGAANDAIMVDVAMGNPVGVPPVPGATAPDQYGVFARRTALDPRRTGFFNGMTYRFPPLGAGFQVGDTIKDVATKAARLSTDWYYHDTTTLNAWQPFNPAEGFITDRVFFGGTQVTGVLGFFSNANEEIDKFVNLGPLSGNFVIGQFYGILNPQAPFQFPVNRWFKLMTVVTFDTNGAIAQGLFVKPLNADGTPTHPGLTDPRIANGEIIPTDGGSAGSGWINVYPGLAVADGGIGRAVTQFGETIPPTGDYGLAELIAAVGVGAVSLQLGIDPPASINPGFVANDVFFDNMTIAGIPIVTPCPLPDFILPYRDRFDLYDVNAAIRPQTDRWFDALSSNAVIVNFGGARNLLNQNFNNDNLFRNEDSSTLPTFPARLEAETADPVVATVRFQVNRPSAPSLVSRAIRPVDGINTGFFAGTVLLGARDTMDPLQSADGTIWIRQPNIGAGWSTGATIWGDGMGTSFDENEDQQDNEQQSNEVPDFSLNLQFINIQARSGSAGGPVVNVPVNSFATIRMEIRPNPDEDPNNPFDDGLLRVFLNGAELFNPSGDPWVAGGTTLSSLQIWSGNDGGGLAEGLFVEDIQISGPIFTPNPGPAFSIPYNDGFESYPVDRSIAGQGSTTFRNLDSTPDQPATDNARKLTALNSNANPISDGTLVCRYEVLELCVDAPGGLAVGDIVALNFDALPDPFNTFAATNVDCPGAGVIGVDFVVRTAENQPRVEEGTWILLNAGNLPEPFNSTTMSGDITNHSFSFTTIARWGVPGVDRQAKVINDPTATGPITEGVPNQVISITSISGIDGSTTDNPMNGVLTSTLPQANAAAESFPNPETTVEMRWSMYIESLDASGMAINAAPRSRMEVAIIGATADSGRITNINFGGPNVNAVGALLAANPMAIVADDLISYTERLSPALGTVDIQRIPTTVSLLTGGAGLQGPLVNTWFDCVFVLAGDSTWEFFIDEGAGPVLVASGDAVDAGTTGLDAPNFVNTSSIDSFNVNIGRDVGSGGEPIPTPFRVRTLVRPGVGTNWDPIAPTNANPSARNTLDANKDYCFYETNLLEEQAPVAQRAQIATVDPVSQLVTGVRALGGNQDVIAVINRGYNPATNTVFGAKIHDPCPVNLRAPLNQFELFSADDMVETDLTTMIPNGTKLVLGRWTALDQAGQAGVNNPAPAGGLSRPSGPFVDAMDTISNSYNNPATQTGFFPAVLAARPIIVARWGMDDADEAATGGRDPFPTILPRARWFIDNLSLTEVGGSACFGDTNNSGAVDGVDLLTVINDFGNGPNGNGMPFDNPAADINGDGVVNGTDLLIVLNNFGPCPI